MAEALSLPPAPLRSPVFDAAGRMTAEWQRYFMQLFQVSALVGAAITQITNDVTVLEGQRALDERNPRDFTAEIQAASSPLGATPKDFTPEIEAALAQAAAATPKDFTPEIEAALAQASAPARDVTPELDELRALLAAIDTPQGGASGTFTAGAVTVEVQNGLIVSIV